MKNTKKLLALLLALIMVASLAACSEAPADDDADNGMDLTDDPADNTADDTSDDDSAPAEEVDVAELVAKYFAEKPDHSYLIKAADIIPRVAADEDIFILDIRSADDYAAGHLAGAVNAPWGGMAIAEAVSQIPADKEVFVYCYSGQTAGQAVMTLNLAGLNARSIAYGWNFGLSKDENIAAVTETAANAFDGSNDVPANVQAAIDAYYAGLAEVSDTTFKNYKVSEAGLYGMISEGEDFFLLSARRPDDFAANHIAGAVNIPYGTAFIDGIGDVPMDKPVVVYCYSGQTAGQATAALRLLGYNAVSLNGGMGTPGNAPLGWMNKNYMVESTNPVYNGVVDYFANKPDHSYIIPAGGEGGVFEKIDAGEDIVIIDIRQPDVYAESHLIGAINVPWNATDIPAALASIPQDKEVFVNCYSGQTAGQAVMTMNLAGINARSIKYGWNLGISKVDGFEAYTETTVNEFGADTYPVDEAVMEAVTAYYADMAGSNIVNSEALNGMIEAGDSFTLISARAADAFAEGHIQGAINVSYGKTFIEGLQGIAKNKQTIVYCYSGQTAGQAVAAMRLLGYDAYSLKSGMGTGVTDPSGWANEGYPVVSE